LLDLDQPDHAAATRLEEINEAPTLKCWTGVVVRSVMMFD
jgi:hypothetical protein